MASNAESKESQSLSQIAPASDLCYVARQPILDARDEVLGFELLFWNGCETVYLAKSGQAFRSLLDNTLLFGLDQLAGGLPAFVNCTADFLTEEWIHLLPPGMTVIELQAEPDLAGDLMRNCRTLKSMGYRLALDGFTGKSDPPALIDLADYVKVDAAKVDAEGRERILQSLTGKAATPIAINVQTQEQYRSVYAEGFKLFQGYYFCHPEMLESHRIPANRMVHLEILELVQTEPVDLQRLSQLVTCDASLTYRLLRLVNSPLCAMRQEVTSIQAALMLIGERTFRNIAMLAIASDFNADQPAEVLRMAFERGRFCELAAGLCGLISSEQYLIGLVSMFPAMLRIPMENLVKALPLREKAREALLGGPAREGILLRWLLGQEREDWAACDAVLRTYNLNGEQIMRYRAEAILWAGAALNAAVRPR
jgi:EAL and modified HD-GYP domain-containing signal transduction protein